MQFNPKIIFYKFNVETELPYLGLNTVVWADAEAGSLFSTEAALEKYLSEHFDLSNYSDPVVKSDDRNKQIFYPFKPSKPLA